MKRLIFILSGVLLMSCFTTPAFAQHCDVKKGDSMWIIAKRYHVSFKELLELNKHFHNQNLIHPKDEVELPSGSEGSNSGEAGSEEDDSAERGESTQAQAVLRIVNSERSKQGLQALKLSSKLTNIANLKAKDMRDNKYFSHQSPTYGTPFQMLQNFGVTYSSAGENIASGQKNAESVMNDWMNSSGHRANILNKNYTELGVGYVEGGSYGTYWVQLFIKP